MCVTCSRSTKAQLLSDDVKTIVETGGAAVEGKETSKGKRIKTALVYSAQCRGCKL